MRFLTIFVCTMLLSNSTMAQKPTPTLEELIPGGSNYCFTENIYGLQWWGDICIKPGIDSIYTIDPQSGKEKLLITRESLNHALTEKGFKKLSHLQSVSFPWSDRTEFLIPQRNTYITYNFVKDRIESVVTVKEGAQNKEYNTANGNVAYTIGNNLYINDTAVTNETKEGIVCGQSVHRNEFGIQKGIFWSPTGNLLAFYRMDESMVSQYPLVDITQRIGTVDNVRYPMAGMTSHKVNVGVYNPATQETIYLETGDSTDRYFTNISWSPDEKSIYLIELNRDQNHAKLCQYSVESGKLTKVLIEEKHEKYVEPQEPITFLPWDASTFIYQSQRDGFNHLYLYSTDGKLLKQLTSGEWLVQSILGFNEKKKEVIISSTEHSPLTSTLFRINVASGKRTSVGFHLGVHSGKLSQTGRYIVDSYSFITTPRKIEIVDTQKNKSLELLTAKDPFEDYDMPKIEVGTIKAADNETDLHYRLVKPTNFDPGKKYPAIIYVYGGPHAQNVRGTLRYAVRGWDVYMATKGYVMLTVDNRGSSNRGLEFENSTFRKLGIEEGKDQMKGAELLKSLPYVDSDRIGVHGWSFGGHMTTALMLRYPETFKVGVAGGPVIDWKYYEVMYGERYMDTPETNPEGYEQTNLNNLAGELKGHLLLIHDDHDDTCVLQHTLSFMKACVEARTYPDLFIYPGHKHNVIGKDRVHLHEKITRYFEEHL